MGTGDDQGCDTQRLVSPTMGRPFVAEGGFGLGRKTREVLAMWDTAHLCPHLTRPLTNNNNNCKPDVVVTSTSNCDVRHLILTPPLDLPAGTLSLHYGSCHTSSAHADRPSVRRPPDRPWLLYPPNRATRHLVGSAWPRWQAH